MSSSSGGVPVLFGHALEPDCARQARGCTRIRHGLGKGGSDRHELRESVTIGEPFGKDSSHDRLESNPPKPDMAAPGRWSSAGVISTGSATAKNARRVRAGAPHTGHAGAVVRVGDAAYARPRSRFRAGAGTRGRTWRPTGGDDRGRVVRAARLTDVLVESLGPGRSRNRDHARIRRAGPQPQVVRACCRDHPRGSSRPFRILSAEDGHAVLWISQQSAGNAYVVLGVAFVLLTGLWAIRTRATERPGETVISGR